MTYSVLVVDDDRAIVALLKEVLEDQGYQVFTGYDGQMGLTLAKAKLPHLILLDISMPMTNGLKTLEFIRQLRETQDIPVIFLTAYVNKDLKPTMESIHRVRYLTKPVDFNELLALMTQMLKMYYPAPQP